MSLQALIDTAALKHNFETLRARAPQSRVMAVVKANAYGHGVATVVKALAMADGFAVARLEEAITLDDLSLTSKPILLLEGVADRSALREALERGFELAIHQVEQLQWLSELAAEKSWPQPLTLWLKFDSGMNRLGFRSAEAAKIETQVLRLQARWATTQGASLGASITCRLMSHFACADEPERSENTDAEQQFAQVYAHWQDVFGPTEASFCNSAALLSRPQSQFAWVRPGISLYGISPFAEQSAKSLGLRPVMTLEAKVIALRSLAAGETVGYGATWRATRSSRVAILSGGYADGLPRHLPSGAPVWVAGHRASIVGRISMDMLAVDVTDIAEVALGSPAVFWGQHLPAEEVATAAGTIAYELLCALNARVPIKVI
jgi:alanine racemase